MAGKVLLECRGVTVRFGGLTALAGLNLTLRRGEMVAIIGPNGAGKTTAFNVLTGVCRPAAGNVLLEGQDITGWRPDRICRSGVARTFQNLRLFKELTVLDNVRVSLSEQHGYGLVATLLRTRAFRQAETVIETEARRLLTALGLKDSAMMPAGTLPYGEQRRLEVARALATGPAVLLLDEPAAGTNTAEKRRLATMVRNVHEHCGLGTLLIDHDMPFVMSLCNRLLVLDHGEMIGEGTPEEVRGNARVVRAYLGEDGDA